MKPIFYTLVWAVFSMGTLCSQSWTPPDSLADLPVVEGLPDLFTFANGDAVRTPHDWLRRREELKAMLLYFGYGHMPERPDQVVVVESERKPHESGPGHDGVIDSGNRQRAQGAADCGLGDQM